MRVAGIAFMLAGWGLGTVAHADEMYGGVGFPGLTLGYAMDYAPNIKLRAEFAGGLSLNKSGVTSGVNYDAKIKANRIGGFADWYPNASGFYVSGGITANDIEGTFNSRGGNSTVNGKTVDLTGLIFNTKLRYPDVTPYVGVGWRHQPASGKGMAFYVDVGLQLGKFNTTVTQNVVGSAAGNAAGLTQADVDAAARDLRDSVNKLSVLPSVSLGVNYRF